jgi:hypothetical protein
MKDESLVAWRNKLSYKEEVDISRFDTVDIFFQN